MDITVQKLDQADTGANFLTVFIPGSTQCKIYGMEGKSLFVQKGFQLQQNIRGPFNGYLFIDNVNTEGTAPARQAEVAIKPS